MITDDQAQSMIMAALAAAHPDPVEEADLKALTNWADDAITDHTLLKMVWDGLMLWTWNGKEPVFKLSKKGNDHAAALDRQNQE